MKNIYIEERDKYIPRRIKAVFVLESPPERGVGYFYREEGRVSEILFRSLLKTLLNLSPSTKVEGLQAFSKAGYLVVDPIYEPVNKLPDKEADKKILQNYNNFKKDLENLLGKEKSKTPVILIKENICRLLEKPLLEDGFNVVNKDVVIPFPMHYHTKEFEEKIKGVMKSVSPEKF